jgi:hypothetical protein
MQRGLLVAVELRVLAGEQRFRVRVTDDRVAQRALLRGGGH